MMLCAHHVPIDYECAACTEVRQAYSGAYSAGLAAGARGRGSRRRYRAAVVEAIERYERDARAWDHEAAGRRRMGRRQAAAKRARRAELHRRAARRARRILAALDAGGERC